MKARTAPASLDDKDLPESRCMVETSVSMNRRIWVKRAQQVAKDLKLLAQFYFDFGPFENGAIDSACRYRMKALYPDPFMSIFRPAMEGKEILTGPGRIRSGLKKQGQSS